jgi:hypothetical protein
MADYAFCHGSANSGLFGGVSRYRQSLHADGIETQKLGKTICDVSTAERSGLAEHDGA